MSDLDPRVRALVDAARTAGPTPADRARIRAALASRLITPGHGGGDPHGLKAGAGTGPVLAPPFTASLGAAVAAKLVVAAVLIGGTGFGGGVLVGTRSAPADLARHGIHVRALQEARVTERWVERGGVSAPPAPAPPEPMVTAPPAEVPAMLPPPAADPPAPPPADPPAQPAAAPPAPPAARPSPVASRPSIPLPASVPPLEPGRLPLLEPGSPPPSSKQGSLVEETRLLGAAQTALRSGDAREALARLDELGARHADGVLREERLAARIVALCAAGRRDEARREAQRFLAEAPLSVHAARVRASCVRATE